MNTFKSGFRLIFACIFRYHFSSLSFVNTPLKMLKRNHNTNGENSNTKDGQDEFTHDEKRQKKTESSGTDLFDYCVPDEILSIIFVIIPVKEAHKSLIRVCKRWYKIYTSEKVKKGRLKIYLQDYLEYRTTKKLVKSYAILESVPFLFGLVQHKEWFYRILHSNLFAGVDIEIERNRYNEDLFTFRQTNRILMKCGTDYNCSLRGVWKYIHSYLTACNPSMGWQSCELGVVYKRDDPVTFIPFCVIKPLSKEEQDIREDNMDPSVDYVDYGIDEPLLAMLPEVLADSIKFHELFKILEPFQNDLLFC